MIVKNPSKIIRTDKWQLNPTSEQKILFEETVKVYRRFCRFLTSIVFTHWDKLGGLSSNEVVPAVERLMHSTAQNHFIKYPQINTCFYKFPSYYRRAAIAFVVGQVSSYMTRYLDWQSGIRSRRDAKPPILNPDAGCYPSLYKGQCYKLQGISQIEIKVFTGKDWIWTTVQITGLRERHTFDSNKMLSPQLVVKNNTCHLSVPFECHPEKRQSLENVVAVDLGINTTARKCRNINQQIAHITSRQIVKIAKQFNSQVIVNGSMNIAARGILKLVRRKDNEKCSSKNPGRLPRSWACLCDLWNSNDPKLA
ncbi:MULTISPECIES: transposase [unclassified Coleofasciculus]|uniref:transposase n=1 Tax=unclassified Coleofasciculus TaxID=2692782 RepID=UPI00187EF404|nr:MULTISPECIES: transposase [unclassified Coleofasciculus]MBE9125981.1 transposase [Coleofasciculus sp. LEGE 07081]MBE9151175.1 transposase [Coleofasciculus sp. LEGE 07092]